MTVPTEPFDETLLTAYLDNELSNEEQERVELHLQSSESTRKLFHELRSIRSLVMEFHQATPVRSFEKGPWNESKVSLANPNSVWMQHGRQIASLAAVVAIAVSGSILYFKPFTNQPRQVSFDRSVKEASATMDSPTSLFESTSSGTSWGETSSGTASSGKASSGTTAGKTENASNLELQVQKKVEANGGRSELSKSRSFQNDLADRTNNRFAAPSAAKPMPSKPALQVEEAPELVELIHYFSYNQFNSKNGVAQFDFRKLDEGRSSGLAAPDWNRTLFFGDTTEASALSPFEDATRDDLRQIEIQVPVDQWGKAATRLRQLGVPVSLEKPTQATLYFEASPQEASDLKQSAEAAQKLKETDLSRDALVAEDELSRTSKWSFKALSADSVGKDMKKVGANDRASSNEPVDSNTKSKVETNMIRIHIRLATDPQTR